MKWGHIALSRTALLRLLEDLQSSCETTAIYITCKLCLWTRMIKLYQQTILLFETTIDGPATEVSSSFEGARLPTRDPQASTRPSSQGKKAWCHRVAGSAFEGAHTSTAIQEHATAADLTKVLEKVTKNTVRDVIKEIKPLFKLGNVKKTKNAKQDDGVINKISDKLD
eukprot:g22663.t1